MKRPLSPALKGLITGLAMIGFAFLLYYLKTPGDSPLQYIAYAIYAGGILWTLLDFRKSTEFTGKFGQLFGQGFRCFIVVTLIMVVFTATFLKLNPQFAEEGSQHYREYLLKNEKSKMPDQIEADVKQYRSQFNTQMTFSSIYGNLIVGAIITAGLSALFMRRNY